MNKPILAILSLTFCACAASSERDDTSREQAAPPMEMVEGSPMYTLLPPDGIPSIRDPEFVTVAEAMAFMQPGEPVMGVVGKNGTAKCYSAWQLDGHEIVNDSIDGEAIAATW